MTEFVIISGPEVHDYLMDIRQQLRSYLHREFPSYRFSLLSQSGEGMGFVVVPVVGSIHDDDDHDDPSVVALANITRALEAFRPGGEDLH